MVVVIAGDLARVLQKQPGDHQQDAGHGGHAPVNHSFPSERNRPMIDERERKARVTGGEKNPDNRGSLT